MACELIGATKQKEGVKVLQEEMVLECDVDRVFLGRRLFGSALVRAYKTGPK